MKIIGRNPVYEALVAKARLKKIYINQDAKIDQKLKNIIDLSTNQGVLVTFKTKRFINKLAQNPMHQGVLAIKEDSGEISLKVFLKRIENEIFDNKDLKISNDTKEKEAIKIQFPFLLYIRDAYNEFNVGAIIRSAEAAGVDAVIIPPKLEITPNMVRAAMGATEHLVIIHENLTQTIKQVKLLGFKTVGIELTGKEYYFDSDLSGAILLIVGGEDKSLSPELEKKVDCFVKIPMLGKVNSLNMSVAASIVMFEKVKQEKIF